MMSGKSKEIDLVALMMAVLRRFWIVVLAVVVFAAAGYVYTKNFVTPMYKTSISFCVNNGNKNQSVTASDLATSQRLVLTYVEGLKSDKVLEAVSNKLGGELPAATIGAMMTADTSSQTEIFRVYITSSDPKQAQRVANAVAKVAPEQIAEFIKGSSATVVDSAKEPTAPFSPNTTRNVMFAGLIGAFLSVLALCLVEVLDVRVKGEEDLAAICTIPVLGVIPDLTTDGDNNYQYDHTEEAEA